MPLTTEHPSPQRPPSPWTRSRYQARHRWQLDQVHSLADVARDLRALAAELAAAHAAGWWLVEPMSSGHLIAARASRRQRARQVPGVTPLPASARPPAPHWRLRVVDEPPVAGQEVFDASTATGTPVLAQAGHRLEQLSGPGIPAPVLAEVGQQVGAVGLAQRRWGVAPARVGRFFDLVADGSGLRLHTVDDGVLVRTHEALAFHHTADGAGTLLQAAAAYDALAETVQAMAAVGGWLVSSDDGFLHVAYHRAAR